MFKDSFNYKAWADERTITAIGKVDRDAKSQAFAFMRQQLNHMVIVEELFRARLSGNIEPHSSTNTEIVPSLEEIKTRLEDSNKWYLGYVANLKDDVVNEVVSFTFADGKTGSMSTAEILFHIVNHGTYHRGNIAHSLDLSGVAHPIDGYGIYIHEAEPQRRAE